jgi:hypothetical protein
MLTQMSRFVVGTVPAKRTEKIHSTLGFDWIYTLLGVLAIVGIWLDVWSHTSFGPDQTVFNEYHLLFYTSVAMQGALLFYTLVMNMRAGYGWQNALPLGYGLSFLATLTFGAAGGLDLIGHALFGFETGFEALISPSHNLLFASIFIISVAPVRAALFRRKADKKLSWRAFLPLTLAVPSLLSTISFPLLSYTIIGGSSWAVQAARTSSDQQGYSLGIMGMFIQTAATLAILLWVIRTLRLPLGGLTAIMVVYSLQTVVASRSIHTIILWALIGVAFDIAYQIIKPHASDPLRFRVFGFVAPLIMWLLYYGYLIVTNFGGGIWYTYYVWLGSIVQAGVVGLAIAYFLSLPCLPTAQTAERSVRDENQ